MLTGYSVTPTAPSRSKKSACAFPLETVPTPAEDDDVDEEDASSTS